MRIHAGHEILTACASHLAQGMEDGRWLVDGPGSEASAGAAWQHLCMRNALVL